MKLNTKIEKVCAEEGREGKYASLVNPYFDGKKIVATNGTILAVIPAGELQIEADKPDTPGFIPVQAIKEARKQKRSFTGSILLGKVAKVEGTATEYPRNPGDQTFPPGALEDNFGFGDIVCKNKVKININPEFLWNIAQAIGAEEGVGLEIDVDKNGKATLGGIKVTGSRHSKAYGVIMPRRME